MIILICCNKKVSIDDKAGEDIREYLEPKKKRRKFEDLSISMKSKPLKKNNYKIGKTVIISKSANKNKGEIKAWIIDLDETYIYVKYEEIIDSKKKFVEKRFAKSNRKIKLFRR